MGIRRALLMTTAERYGQIVINLITISVVSRLLTPGEIGLAVLGITIGVIGVTLREFATPNILIQLPELRQADINVTTTIYLIINIALSAGILVLAPFFANFYGDDRLTFFLYIVSSCILAEFIFFPIEAVMKRDMQFDKLAVIQVSGAVIGAAVTLSAAAMGGSYLSFAWGWLGQAVVISALAIYFHPNVVNFRPSIKNWRSIISFGGYNGINAILGRVYELLPYLILGRIISMSSVGLYNRSLLICQLPNKVFTGGVASLQLAAFSALRRNETSLKKPFLYTISLITGVQWPALLCIAILADPLILLILGPQWSEISPLVRIMALASLFSVTADLTFPILVSVGAMRDLVSRAVIIFPISGLVIALAAFFGLTTVALSWFLVVPFQSAVSFLFLRKHIEISVSDLLGALSKSAVVALSTAIALLPLVLLSGGRWDLLPHDLPVAVVLSAIGWLFGLWITGHPLFAEVQNAMSFMIKSSGVRKASDLIIRRLSRGD